MLNVRKLTWEIRDKNGQLKSFEVHRPNSYVQHLINTLYCMMANTTLAAQIDTGGTSRTMQQTGVTASDRVTAANLDGTFGLVVGTGTTAVSISQTALVTKIDHGNGAGQLSHGAVTVTAPGTTGGTRSFTIQRTFTNNSGNAITVNEIGIYALLGAWIFMIERSLSTKTINNLTSGTLTYTIGTTV